MAQIILKLYFMLNYFFLKRGVSQLVEIENQNVLSKHQIINEHLCDNSKIIVDNKPIFFFSFAYTVFFC